MFRSAGLSSVVCSARFPLIFVIDSMSDKANKPAKLAKASKKQQKKVRISPNNELVKLGFAKSAEVRLDALHFLKLVNVQGGEGSSESSAAALAAKEPAVKVLFFFTSRAM